MGISQLSGSGSSGGESLLAAVAYDPAIRVTKSCTSTVTLTAFDTTNARVIFTAPSSGRVKVRIACTLIGASGTYPSISLGALSGATKVGKAVPALGQLSTGNTTRAEVVFSVTGLTSGASYTYDAAYQVNVLLAGANLAYGGSDAAGSAEGGALSFEVYG